jgi:hypothetical protein
VATTRYVKITALKERNRPSWWSIAELRTNRDEDVVEVDPGDTRVERVIRAINAQGLAPINAVTDETQSTFATSRGLDYVGNWVLADLGGSYTVSRVAQVHIPNDQNYPGRYRIEVSENGRSWQGVWEGEGEAGRSIATFAPVRTRFVRLTALATRRTRTPWSISRLRIAG